MTTMSTHTSIYVAPLHLGKSRSRAASITSKPSRPTSSRSVRSCPARSQAELTPPATPHGSQEALVPQPPPQPSQPIFHTFLRAFYPYHPGYTGSTSTVTLPMNEGDIILVHSIHTNGWADGTLLISGARGWLPTNYCEAYDHDHIRNLMNALLNFWDLLRGRISAELEVFRNQEYVRGLIAGVRYLLEKSECLTRDSPIVQAHDGLRRNRKGLLSDLSSLVKTAKKLQDIASGREAVDDIESLVDEMILKAFKIVNRGVRFLDIRCADVPSKEERQEAGRALLEVPLTPPADSVEFPNEAQATEQTTLDTSTTPRQNHVQTRSDLDTLAPLPSSQIDTETKQQTENVLPKRFSGSVAGNDTRPNTPKASSRPTSIQGKRQSASHRISYTGKAAGLSNPKLSSERLRAAYDTFISSQASFIGRLQLQSRSSSELLMTTQQSVVACRDLLSIVEAVWNRDMQRADALESAKTTMYSRITDMVQATRDIFRMSSSAEIEDILLPSQVHELECVATDCVKAASDCVSRTKLVLERIGDFEFETVGLGISEAIAEAAVHVEAEQVVDDVLPCERTSTPPQPLSKPPPPPAVPVSEELATDRTDYSEDVSPVRVNVQDTAISGEAESAAISIPGSLLPPIPSLASPLLPPDSFSPIDSVSTFSDHFEATSSFRTEGGISSNGTNSTYISGQRTSNGSIISPRSSRATTPENDFGKSKSLPSIETSSFDNGPSLGSDFEETEAKMLEKTYAHELIYNKDGQITGGTLPALVERLTTHDSTPDSMFVSTFYLTFRLFATPVSFAQALVDRFDYVGNSPHVSTPVRLRVYNVFKGWIESHWRSDHDREALDIILDFAIQKLSHVLPTASSRLMELADKVSAVDAPLVPRLVSSIGKTNTSISQYIAPDTPLPSPVISKSQLNQLKNWKLTGNPLSIMDFDPLELARQFTIKESRIFCSILPEELLATEWMKKSGSSAVNVRAMSTLSTDLANLVADTILHLEDAKKRAATIKQWVKIAKRCLELKNYDSLMAIMCSLDSSTILRLKRTWELVTLKTKSTLDHLRGIMDISKNYLVLRQTLQNQVPPCLPFVGTYLTDLTFVDVGNQMTRHLPGDGDSDGIAVINFAKHTQTAKIIGDLQRFQIPYRLTEIPEMQQWIEHQIQRVQGSDGANIQEYYRRSLRLEPREQATPRASPVEPQQPTFPLPENKKFDFLSWSHSSKEKPTHISGVTTPT